MGFFKNIGKGFKKATSSVGKFIKTNVKSVKKDVSGFVDRNVKSIKKDVAKVASNGTFQNILTSATSFIPGVGGIVSNLLGTQFSKLNAKNSDEQLQAEAQVLNIPYQEYKNFTPEDRKKKLTNNKLKNWGILAGIGTAILLLIKTIKSKK